MSRILPAAGLIVLLLSACIRVESQLTDVTVGTVPPQIQGAHWTAVPVSYCTVRDDEGGYVDYPSFVALTERAIAAWGVPAAYLGDCGHEIIAGNGMNEIGWGDLGVMPGNLNEAGNTNIRYRTTSAGAPPQIIEADIAIEREPARGRASEECLYTTLLHETGHLFGVPHLEGDVVMSPVISDCLRELTAADRAALAELY